MHFGKFIFFAIVAGGLAFAAAFYEKVPLHMFATGMVVIYGVLLFIHIRKTNDAHAQHPESVYIVGYIATIGGFAGLAVYLGRNSGQIADFKTVLPMILERGGFAVVSTLVGLVAMNVLKMQADGDAGVKLEQEEFAQQIATQISKSLGNAEQTAEFTQNMAQMAGQMAGNIEAMNHMQATAREVEGVMQAASQQMPQLVEGLARFEELSNKVLPVWDRMAEQADEAAKLNTALANSAEAMERVQKSSVASATAIETFAQSLPVLQQQFTGMLEQIRLRLDTLNRFGDELTRFLDYARTANPILVALGDGFGNVGEVKANLQLVSDNLKRTNDQLITFNQGAIELTQTSGDFGRNIGTLGSQISTAMTELARLTKPLQQIGKMAEQAASASQWFEGHGDGLEKFKDNLTGMVAAAEGLKGAVEKTEEAVGSSARTLQQLQILMPQLASARATQLERL